jgi:hypothetical protein
MDALADPSFFRTEANEALVDAEHKAALAMTLSRWSELCSMAPARLALTV